MSWEIAIITGVGLIAFIFYFISNGMQREDPILSLLFFLMSVVTVIFDIGIMVIVAELSSQSGLATTLSALLLVVGVLFMFVIAWQILKILKMGLGEALGKK